MEVVYAVLKVHKKYKIYSLEVFQAVFLMFREYENKIWKRSGQSAGFQHKNLVVSSVNCYNQKKC